MPTPTCWCKYNVHGYLMVKLIVKLCVDSTVYMLQILWHFGLQFCNVVNIVVWKSSPA